MNKECNFKKVADRDYYDGNGVLLVPKGKVLDLQTWVKVKKHAVEIEKHLDKFEGNPVKKESFQNMLKMEMKYDIIDSSMIKYTKDILHDLLYNENNPWDFHIHAMSNYLYFVYSHTINTSILLIMMAMKFGFSKEKISQIALGSILHDIGELLLPKSILMKRSDLNDEERRILKKHPELGYSMLEDFKMPELSKKMVLYHHERLDGSGYPFQFTKQDLPIEIQLLMVADAFDAMTSYRVYRETMSIEEAYQYLCQHEEQYSHEATETIGKIFKI